MRRGVIAVNMKTYMQSDLEESSDNTWQRIAPMLDTAVAALSDKDRSAIVLRFYEGRNLSEVAAALGASEEAAKKRVTRAVERLKRYFDRRGVTSTAATIAGAISANSVHAAPLGLTVSICTVKSAAVAASVTTLVNGTLKTIFMTTFQKTLIAVTLVAAVGAGIYEAREASTLQREVQGLHQQQAPLTELIQQLTRERDEATNRLAEANSARISADTHSAELLRLRGEGR